MNNIPKWSKGQEMLARILKPYIEPESPWKPVVDSILGEEQEEKDKKE